MAPALTLPQSGRSLLRRAGQQTGRMTGPDQKPEEQKDTQTASTGADNLLERRYWIEFQRPRLGGRELMDDIKLNIEEYAPGLLANFEKTVGDPRTLQVGDQFGIRILGPWNGDVRVTDVNDLSFSFETLEGHPEAGTICFSLTPHEDFADAWHFEIRSLAASRDGLVAFTYDTLGVGKKMQEQTWVTFCQRVLEKSGGEALGDIQVRTLEKEEMPAEVQAEAE